MQYLEDVYRFHEKFQIPQPKQPCDVAPDVFDFRSKFMQEELDEFRDAYAAGDKAKQLDALVDLVYVALGTALMFGFDFDRAWFLVQQANMKKVAGIATGRHGTLDVTKPEGWKPPDLDPIVRSTHVRMYP